MNKSDASKMLRSDTRRLLRDMVETRENWTGEADAKALREYDALIKKIQAFCDR